MGETREKPAAACPENADLAERLEHVAELLASQDANPFRVGAYRRASETLRALPEPVSDVFVREGVLGLERLPGIGASIASLIREYVRSGRISLHDRLVGEVSAEALLASVPGMGPVLARRVHDELGVETLEDLEVACHDGRLAAVRGFGERRLAAIAASVAALLGRPARGRAAGAGRRRLPVETLLEVDGEYRRRAEAGDLPRIAPRRLNPRGEAWLPVLHAERDGWHVTALFSNTARAHELGRTRDWVVIYAERDGDQDQCTVVTRGGRRVVRGREAEAASP